MKCGVCGQEFEDNKLTIVTPYGSSDSVCDTCFNLYANHMFEELTERIEKFIIVDGEQ